MRKLEYAKTRSYGRREHFHVLLDIDRVPGVISILDIILQLIPYTGNRISIGPEISHGC